MWPLALALLLLLSPAGASAQADADRLRVGSQGRFLVHSNGEPFFYLGDTAWALFARTTRAEAERYLRDREQKGFTVVQAVVLLWTLEENAYGAAPLRDGDPTRPNEAYFRYVDWVIQRAEARGLRIGLLPTWGNHVTGRGAERLFDVESARAWGEFLGRRYADAPVIWILGGDTAATGVEEVWRAMARGIEAGTRSEGLAGDRALLTFHPRAHTHSSRWFHGDEWLDFNMIQSGHCENAPNFRRIAYDRAKTPAKPILDGEPRYENMPSCLSDVLHSLPTDLRDRLLGRFALLGAWLHRWLGLDLDTLASAADSPRITAWEVRKAAWWSVLAGALGHTYGAAEVFAFWEPGDANRLNWYEIPWRHALNYPGAGQMVHVKRLLESRPPLARVPDQSLLRSDPGFGDEHFQVARDAHGRYMFVYSSSGRPFDVDLEALSASRLRAHWYDPREGSATFAGERLGEGVGRFEPPSSGAGEDWVLVIDDAAQGFPEPGATARGPARHRTPRGPFDARSDVRRIR